MLCFTQVTYVRKILRCKNLIVFVNESVVDYVLSFLRGLVVRYLDTTLKLDIMLSF